MARRNPIPSHWADDISDEQLDALHEYAAWAGPKWKAQLGMDWMRAGSGYAGYATLHQLRNSHGPSWLAKVRLPHGDVK